MLKATDCPALTVNGSAGAITLKAAPVTLAWETVRFEPPVLLTTVANDDVVVAGMLLKVNAVGDIAITGGGTVTVTVADADFVVSATLVALTL